MNNTAKSEPTGSRMIFALVLLLCLAGLGVSIELTDVHHATHTDPDYKSVCAVSDEVNCETVARSPYSIFLGAPVSVWGILGYLLMTFFAVWRLKGSRHHENFPTGVLFALILFAFGAAGMLAFISFTRIDSVCLFCMTLYVINIALLALVSGHLLRRRQNPLRLLARDLRALFLAPLQLSGIAVPAIGASLALLFAIPPYWQHAGWQELPDLPTGASPGGGHWIGAKEPLLTIVEFSDYECPFCRRAHKEMRIKAAAHPEEIRLVHRHLPLDQACNEELDRRFHIRACELAKAAECAAEQDRFWPMNDALFSVQDTMRVKDVDLEMLAVELGLDRSDFNACMARPGTPRAVTRDMAAAKKLDVQGTPTFFIGVQPYEGQVPGAAIEGALKAARARRAAARPGTD